MRICSETYGLSNFLIPFLEQRISRNRRQCGTQQDLRAFSQHQSIFDTGESAWRAAAQQTGRGHACGRPVCVLDV
jgi:hypothetical protein